MAQKADKITELERIAARLERFIDDKDFRKELGRNFTGFTLSGDDIMTFEALTEYLAILKQRDIDLTAHEHERQQ
jgi:hypothetical protein